MNLLKPQYSLRWIFIEMTLAAIAVACFSYFYRTLGLYRPVDVFWPFFGFFIAAGAAVGGLVHWPVAGAFAGMGLAFFLWILVIPSIEV